MKRIWVVILGVSMVWSAFGEDMHREAELVIYGESTDMTNPGGPSYSLVSVLQDLPQVAVSEQGGAGGQSDMSIRGSVFSGAGMSVNGLAFANAQTEHFNTELPFFPGLFYQPVVLTGFDQVLETEGHLVGTVDMRIKPLITAAEVSAGFGEYESYWIRGMGSEISTNISANGHLGISVFGGYDRFNHVNYEDNNNQNKNGGGALQWRRDDLQFDLLSGYKEKGFGARGYYGVNPDYAADERIKDFTTIGSVRKGVGSDRFHASMAYRDLHDDYRLYLPTSLYHNEHQTRTANGQAGGRQSFYRKAGLNWRLSGVQENMESESLGDHHRARGALTIIPEIRAKQFVLYAGVRQEVYSRESSASLPQAAVEWWVTDVQLLKLSYAQSVRQPSYTEFNYRSPASLGNEGLANQQSESVNLEWRTAAESFDISLNGFMRSTRDTIDWVRESQESTRWTAQNIGTVDIAGIEVASEWSIHRALQLRGGVIFLNKESDAKIYSSRYALDYARVSVKGDALWTLCKYASLALSQSYRQQDENPLRAGGNEQWLGTLRLSLLIPTCQDIRVDITVDNLWDDTFEEFPGQDTATGRRYYAGVTALF